MGLHDIICLTILRYIIDTYIVCVLYVNIYMRSCSPDASIVPYLYLLILTRRPGMKNSNVTLRSLDGSREMVVDWGIRILYTLLIDGFNGCLAVPLSRFSEVVGCTNTQCLYLTRVVIPYALTDDDTNCSHRD